MLLHIDGFDHYTNTEGAGNRIYELDPLNWSSVGVAADNHGDFTTMPSLGSSALRCQFTGGNTGVQCGKLYALPATIQSGDTLGIGFHYYMNDLPNNNSRAGIIGFGSAAAQQRCFRMSSSGNLVLTNGSVRDGSTVGSASSSGLSAAVLYHIEIQIFFHATLGSYEIRVNGATWHSQTNIDTLPASGTHIWFAPGHSTAGGGDADKHFYDNLYLYDDSGAYNNNWLGERVVYTLFPDADTATEDWALSGGSDSFDLVNDVPPNPSNYIESDALDDQTTLTLDALSNTNVSIVGVQTFAYAQKTDTGPGDFQMGVVKNSTEELSSNESPTQSQYSYFYAIFEENPDTNDVWDSVDIASTEVTIKRV